MCPCIFIVVCVTIGMQRVCLRVMKRLVFRAGPGLAHEPRGSCLNKNRLIIAGYAMAVNHILSPNPGNVELHVDIEPPLL